MSVPSAHAVVTRLIAGSARTGPTVVLPVLTLLVSLVACGVGDGERAQPEVEHIPAAPSEPVPDDNLPGTAVRRPPTTTLRPLSGTVLPVDTARHGGAGQAADRAADPGRMIVDFLAGLPEATRSEPLSDDELADTVFGGLPSTSLVATTTAFQWGDIGRQGTSAQPELLSFSPCRTGEGCLSQARAIPRGEAVRHPELAAVARPDVEKYLASPLQLSGQGGIIAEVRHADARKRIARAVCVDGVPTIQYSPDISANYSPLAFAFVRAHEYSHWQEGHIRCGPIQPPPGRGMPPVHERELTADCQAAKILTRDIQFGAGIVVLVAERFWEMNWQSIGGYPSTRDRADAVYRDECEYADP